MLSSIVLNHTLTGFRERVFDLIDSDFLIKVHLPRKNEDAPYPSYAPRTAAVVIAYKQKNLPVAPNVARMHIWLAAEGKLLPPERNLFHLKCVTGWIDQYYPELEYGLKYNNCVLRQLDRLSYVKNFRFYI